jgi:hypothetical protein
MADAMNIVVTNLNGQLDVVFNFECVCGTVHDGHEISRRPVRFVEAVRSCGSTKVFFDYRDAKFFDAVLVLLN